MFTLIDQPFFKLYVDRILKSGLHNDNKVERLSNMINISERFEAKLKEKEAELLMASPDEQVRLVAAIAQDLGIWHPIEIMRKVKESIQSAIIRLKNSQHPEDGGWGTEWRKSKYWETAWALLSLHEVAPLRDDMQLPEELNKMIERGLCYFRNNKIGWAPAPTRDYELNNYDMPLVLRCLSVFRSQHTSDIQNEIYKTLDLVVSNQNLDGGWNQTIWSPKKYASTTKIEQGYSDVSPTSQILQVLVCHDPKRYQDPIEKAFHWVLRYQNDDGSWDEGCRLPGKEGIYREENGEFRRGFPTIAKTCDGLEGMFAATEANLVCHDYYDLVNKAVAWLEEREEPLFEIKKPFDVEWSSYDYTNTCITLEALVNHPDPHLPLRTSNALWLIDNQRRLAPDNPDNGKWPYELTPRIAHCLLQFYKKISSSPLFITHQEPNSEESHLP
jgi:hypothetical protein